MRKTFFAALVFVMLWIAPGTVRAQSPTPEPPVPQRTPTAHILPGFDGQFAPSMSDLSAWGFNFTAPRSSSPTCAVPVPFTADYAKAQVEPACAAPYAQENKPQAVVIHATGSNYKGALMQYRSGIESVHYVIDKDGTVYQLLPEKLPARHVSCTFGCLSSCPAQVCGDGYPELRTIGIAMVNYGQVPQDWTWGSVYEDYLMSWNWRWWDDYTDAQIAALKALIADITARRKIPQDADHILPAYRVQMRSEPGPALNLFWQRAGSPAREAVFR